MRGLAAEPEAQLAEGGIERLAEHESERHAEGWPFAFPHDVQDDVLEGGVTVVAVGTPAAGTEVNFDVASLRRAIAGLHDGAAEIGAALDAAKTRMKDTDGLSVQGLKLIAE